MSETTAKYIVFAGTSFYANGGMLDFKGAFGSLDLALIAAQDLIRSEYQDWFHIVHTETWEIVAYMPGEYCGSGDGLPTSAVRYWPDDSGTLHVSP